MLDDFGFLGRAWRETDEADTNRETLVQDLLDGQYDSPVRIVAFNTAEGWSGDVTEDIADELRDRCAEVGDIPVRLQELLDRYHSESKVRQLTTDRQFPGPKAGNAQ